MAATSAAGGYVDDDRHRRSYDFFNDVAGRVGQASGRVQLDQNRLVFFLIGFGQGAADKFVADGLNGVIEDNLKHLRRSGSGTSEQ